MHISYVAQGKQLHMYTCLCLIEQSQWGSKLGEEVPMVVFPFAVGLFLFISSF